MSSLLLRSLVLALLLGTAPIAASAEDGAEAGDEPLVIGMDDLAGITAGSHATPWGPAGRPTYRRSTRIETHISMPIAHAIAVCYFCSGNASAVAMATAVGEARADSFAATFGDGFSFADSFAAGPGWRLMEFGPAAPPRHSGGGQP